MLENGRNHETADHTMNEPLDYSILFEEHFGNKWTHTLEVLSFLLKSECCIKVESSDTVVSTVKYILQKNDFEYASKKCM